jgi:carboxymethylenebutenolidase
MTGFDVTYLPFGLGGPGFRQKVLSLHSDLELGESYAIIAYGDPAAVVLDCAHKPMPHLCALIAYYPSTVTKPATKFPPHVEYQVHMAATQRGKVQPPTDDSVRCYWYEETQPGFAESDLDEWDGVANGLAWTRALTAVRKAFKVEVDLERVQEQNYAGKLGTIQRMLSKNSTDNFLSQVSTERCD